MMSKTSINDLTTDRHPGSLEISVSGLGKNIFFRVKPETKLSRLIDACWDHRGVRFEERSWRLPRQGGYLEATDCGDTFAQLGLVDGDVIAAGDWELEEATEEELLA